MIDRIARKLTTTLRHHGVEMHPDDVRGLAIDAVAEMRQPSIAMMRAMNRHANILMPTPAVFWQVALDATSEEA